MKYVSEHHDHVYYVSPNVHGDYSVRHFNRGSIPGKTLDLTKDQYNNFQKMLKDGGWNEQSTIR